MGCVSKLAKFAAAALSVVASAAGAQEAQSVEPRFEVTPWLAYRGGGQFESGTTGENLSLASKLGYALALEWPATEYGTQYELLYSRQRSDTGGITPVDMTVEYLQIGGLAVVGDDTARVVPYAVGGLGVARFSPDAASLSTETRFALNLGGGVRVPIANHVRLRFEVRGYVTWLNGSSNLFCSSSAAGAGCAIQAKGQTLLQYEALSGVSIGF